MNLETFEIISESKILKSLKLNVQDKSQFYLIDQIKNEIIEESEIICTRSGNCGFINSVLSVQNIKHIHVFDERQNRLDALKSSLDTRNKQKSKF